MATYGVSSDASWGYTVWPRPPSTVSTKGSPVETSPVETSPLEGQADAPIYRFTEIPDLRKRVHSQSDALVAGRITQQYLVFRGVTKDNLTQIDHQRTSIGKHTRITYYADTDRLVIKLMPSGEHEAAHISLAYEVNDKLRGMGLPKQSLYGLGSKRFVGRNSSKEGDSTYKPLCRTRKDDWPTIIFEAGLSESLTRLRLDAQWWLTNSGGEVKIAIVIAIVPAQKSLRIEQWCLSPPLRPGPVTRAVTRAAITAATTAATTAHPNANPPVPMKIQELTVIQDPPLSPLPGTIPTYTVTGVPLTLEFEKLLLRAPVLPEGNVIFTAADLQAWAGLFWSMFV
jgi:hypothetical protein